MSEETSPEKGVVTSRNPTLASASSTRDMPVQASRSGEHAVFLNDKMEQEKRKLNLAPVFDRLVESNLELTTQVQQLVKASHYVLASSVLAVLSTLIVLVIALLRR